MVLTGPEMVNTSEKLNLLLMGSFACLQITDLLGPILLALPVEPADNALQEIQGPHAIGNL